MSDHQPRPDVGLQDLTPAPYENKAVVTLKGDRGTTMLCRFNLDAGGAGMGGGGTGEC